MIDQRELDRQAQQVWKLMHSAADTRGFALQRTDYGDGRVIVGAIAEFIRELAKDRGWSMDKRRVGLLRDYLRTTGNVVALSRFGDELYRWRIFVREDWKDTTIPVIRQRGSPGGNSQQADNEEDYVGAVTTTTVLDELDLPMSLRQVNVLRWLADVGPLVATDDRTVYDDYDPILAVLSEDPAATEEAKAQHVGTVLRQLEDKGLARLEKPSPAAKRFSRLALTDRGKIVAAEDPWHLLTAPEALAAYLQEVEEFDASRPSNASTELQEALGPQHTRPAVTRAVRVLEDQECVLVDRGDNPNASIRSVLWVCEDPAHHGLLYQPTDAIEWDEEERGDRPDDLEIEEAPCREDGCQRSAIGYGVVYCPDHVADYKLDQPPERRVTVDEMDGVFEPTDPHRWWEADNPDAIDHAAWIMRQAAKGLEHAAGRIADETVEDIRIARDIHDVLDKAMKGERSPFAALHEIAEITDYEFE